jgi:hypothetical protein
MTPTFSESNAIITVVCPLDSNRRHMNIQYLGEKEYITTTLFQVLLTLIPGIGISIFLIFGRTAEVDIDD